MAQPNHSKLGNATNRLLKGQGLKLNRRPRSPEHTVKTK
jgi:hypothetical protein